MLLSGKWLFKSLERLGPAKPSQIQSGLQSVSFYLLGGLWLRDVKAVNSRVLTFLPCNLLRLLSAKHAGTPSHSSVWIAQVAGTLNTFNSYLMSYLQVTLHHTLVLHSCLLQAAHGWPGSSVASSRKTQLSQHSESCMPADPRFFLERCQKTTLHTFHLIHIKWALW